MKKKDISRLLQRYLTGHQEGKDAYFDADEIDELLDSFEESDDYTYYDEVLALGLRLHPGNPDLQIRQCKSYVYNEDYDSALALGVRVVFAIDFRNLAVLVFLAACTFYDISVFQANFLAGSHTEKFLRSIFHKVFPFDPQIAAEFDRMATCR